MRLAGSRTRGPATRPRLLIAVVAGLAVAITTAGIVFADAPDPKPEQAKVRVGPTFTINGVAVARVSVSGGWQWPTHKSNCNTNRTGVGFAVDWNDPGQGGNHVTTLNGESIDVGAASGNDRNPADNEAHPTRPEEAGSQYSEPGSPSGYASWRGGCGTYNGSFNTGVWGAVDLATGAPITCTSTTSPNPTCLGGSHVYTIAALQAGVRICAIMYDVHGGDSNKGGAPNGAKEITAGGSGHNGDNGAEKNDSTPLGNTCSPIDIPRVTPTPTPTPTPSTTPTPGQTPTPTPARTPTPTPTKTPGDESCPFNTIKFTTTNITDGNKTDGDFVVLVNYYGNNDKQFLAFKAMTNHVVKNLIVTGTGGSQRYNFNPAITGGQGFSEPASIQISRVTFCYMAPPATPTPPPSATPPCNCNATPTPIPTPTPVKTPTPTPTPVKTPTPPPPTPTPTPLKTPTPPPTPCTCKTPTPTPTPTPTLFKTPSPTPTPFKTPSPTPTPVRTPTPTPTPTQCVCPTPTPTPILKTPSPTPTLVPPPTPTRTPTPTPFKTPSPTPTPVRTPTPTPTPTPCICPSPTPLINGIAANQPPVPMISKPSSSYTWGAGVVVGFAGSANDPEDGALGAAKLSWQVIWHNGGDTVLATANGVAGGTFTAPGSQSGTIEIILTATDSGGASSSVSQVYNHR